MKYVTDNFLDENAGENAEAVIKEFRNQYENIHDNYFAMLDECGDNTELRGKVFDNLQNSLNNYLNAQNAVLNGKADEVAAISKQATAATKAIDKALKNLKQIKETLDTITTIVTKIGEIIPLFV